MRTYPVTRGDVLVFSVDGGAWETITFRAGDFAQAGAATAAELAAAVNRSGSLAAFADEQEQLVLATAGGGAEATIEVDLGRSTAASALGLSTGRHSASGSGLSPARIRSLNVEPFAIPAGGELRLEVDGRAHLVAFTKGISAGKATSAEVCQVINAKRRVATPTRDGRVMLVSPSVGPSSRLEVKSGRAGKQDAATPLGFVGAAAISWPHRSDPAVLVCAGRRAGVQVVNLTAGPVELHLAGGAAHLPPGASIPLAGADVASPAVQRLVMQGVVRVTGAAQG
jgi:hypothetical protein